MWQNAVDTCAINITDLPKTPKVVSDRKENYPDKAATSNEENIPTDPSPIPFFLRSSASVSALFLNIW